MNGARITALVVGVIALACVAFVVVLLLVKALWAWTVPDLFPGAAQRGLVADSISWLTAVKIALFVAVLSGCARGAEAHIEKKQQMPESGRGE